MLAASVYGNPTLRQPGDLDILVQDGDVARAQELLACLGFRFREQLDRESLSILRRTDYEYRLCRKSNDVHVGLHWDVWPKNWGFAIDALRLFEDPGEVSFSGAPVPVPAPGKHLLLLCAHGAKDCWVRMVGLSDVARLIQIRQLDWERLLGEARRQGLTRLLLLGVLLAGELSGVTLPPPVRRIAGFDCVLPDLVEGRLRNLLIDRPYFMDDLERRTFLLALRERFRDRISPYSGLVHHLDWRTPRSIDRAFLQLPRLASPLYPAFWAVRFPGRYLFRPARRFVRAVVFAARRS